jgi:hypothetical protein
VSRDDPATEGVEKEERSEERDIEEQKPLAVPEEMEEKGKIVPENDILPFDPELLEGAPAEVRRSIQMAFSMLRMGGPSLNPLATAVARVLDGDHLTNLIESMDRSAELELRSTQQARWTNLLYLIVVLVFAGFALWLLKDSNPDLLRDLIAIVASLAGGLGAGYGIKAWAEQKRR